VFVEDPKVTFRDSVALSGRFSLPLERLVVSPLLVVTTASVVLCCGVTLRGCLLVVSQRRVDVSLHAFAVEVETP